MAMAQCMQNVAICLLKRMQAIHEDQVISRGRINGSKERVAWALMQLNAIFAMIRIPVKAEFRINANATGNIDS